MTISISIRADIDRATRDLTAVQQRQIPFATSRALGKTASDMRAALQRNMRTVFDRPTPFTVAGVLFRLADKRRLDEYSVFLRDEIGKGATQAEYLLPQVEGGGRMLKRFERSLLRSGIMRSGNFAVPGRGARLNQYGNISPGQIVQILSALRANPDPLSNRSNSPRSRRRARRAQYFVLFGRLAGIWQRTGAGITPVLKFVRPPRYKVRFNFATVGQAEARRVFAGHFRAALSRALATARS